MARLKILLAQHGRPAPAGLLAALRDQGFEVETTRNQADTWIALRAGGHHAVLLMPLGRDPLAPEFSSLLPGPDGPDAPALLVLTDDPGFLAEHIDRIDEYLSPDDAPGAIAGRVVLGVARRRARERLLRESSTDFKTGLPNDRRFAEQCRIECARAEREEHPLSLLLIDLDEFKRINDEHDHDFGDHALRQLADTLRAGLRPFDTPARKGGDEFAVLLPHTSLAQAANIAERLRGSVAQLQLDHGGHRRRLTISLGVATWLPKGGETFEQALLGADKALLSAKALGRNRVELHVPAPAGPAGQPPQDLASQRRGVPEAAPPPRPASPPAAPRPPASRSHPAQPARPPVSPAPPPPGSPPGSPPASQPASQPASSPPPARRRAKPGSRSARGNPPADGE